MKRTTVLLADDHAVVTDGLRRILEPDFEVVGTVENGRALVAAAAKLRPDVIVVDISMPLLNGIEAVRQIMKSDSHVRAVFLTMHSDVTYAAEALRAGGSAYVLKTAAGAEVITAIEAALKGRVFVSRAIADRMQKPAQGISSRTAPQRDLTSRELEVLQLVAEGHTIKEVAQILNLSPRTAEYHKYHIFEKLGLKTTAELTQYAIRHGIVSA